MEYYTAKQCMDDILDITGCQCECYTAEELLESITKLCDRYIKSNIAQELQEAKIHYANDIVGLASSVMLDEMTVTEAMEDFRGRIGKEPCSISQDLINYAYEHISSYGD